MPQNPTLAFPPEKALALATQPEIDHTSKHGSWLNVAEIAAMTKHCLGRSTADRAVLNKELTALAEATSARSSGDSPPAAPHHTSALIPVIYTQHTTGDIAAISPE